MFVAGTLATKPSMKHSRVPCRMRVDLPLHEVFLQDTGEQKNICDWKLFPESMEETTLWTSLYVFSRFSIL